MFINTKSKVKKDKYIKTWLAFVQISACEGFDFNKLIDSGDNSNEIFTGAWANIILKANTIKEAIDLIPLGLRELNFSVVFIDKIENISSLVEYDEIDRNLVLEVDSLLESNYVFKIYGDIYPYI